MAEGLYIHIPFCDHICGYCDFARGLYNEDLANQYLAALNAELVSKNPVGVKTIYIGGGTPTALSLSQLERLFIMISPYMDAVVEFTIEANPESLTKAKAALFKQFGVNRVSMGMQVTQSELLVLIERKHTFEDVREKVEILKDVGINDISIDLMYGIPTQSLKDLQASLEKIISLDITHVSLYGLTIEPDSKFGKKGYKEAEANLDADMYEYALEYLEANGFMRYEISNFAKPNFQSLHNKVYWKYKDFVAVGLYASGKERNIRYTNTRSLKDYISNDYLGEEIILSKDDEVFEYIMMNLRLSEGFRISEFNERFDLDFEQVYSKQIKQLSRDGLLVVSDNIVKASSYGLEILHNVIEQFISESD